MRSLPGPRANRDAFLLIESERRVLGARLRHAHRPRRDRYRDLILITKLIRLEHEHLVGRVGPRVRSPSLPEGPPALGGDTPADWSQTWGVGATYELRTAFIHYSRLRDRLARRLSARTQASAAADAKRHLDRIFSRFEGVIGDSGLEFKQQRVSAPEPHKREAQPLMAAAGKRNTADEMRSWASPLITEVATIAAAVLVIAALDAVIYTGGGWDSGGALSRTPASVPQRLLAALGNGPREPQPAGGRGAGQGAPHRSGAPQQLQSDASNVRPAAREGDQTAPTTSQVTPPTPEPTPEAAPAPTSAPAPVVASAPAPAPAPATTAQQEFGFEN